MAVFMGHWNGAWTAHDAAASLPDRERERGPEGQLLAMLPSGRDA